MAQVTIYLSESKRKKASERAKRLGRSLSQLVQEALEQYLDDSWPSDFVELFGSLKDSDLERPQKGDFSTDSKRIKL